MAEALCPFLLLLLRAVCHKKAVGRWLLAIGKNKRLNAKSLSGKGAKELLPPPLSYFFVAGTRGTPAVLGWLSAESRREGRDES